MFLFLALVGWSSTAPETSPDAPPAPALSPEVKFCCPVVLSYFMASLEAQLQAVQLRHMVKPEPMLEPSPAEKWSGLLGTAPKLQRFLLQSRG